MVFPRSLKVADDVGRGFLNIDRKIDRIGVIFLPVAENVDNGFLHCSLAGHAWDIGDLGVDAHEVAHCLDGSFEPLGCPGPEPTAVQVRELRIVGKAMQIEILNAALVDLVVGLRLRDEKRRQRVAVHRRQALKEFASDELAEGRVVNGVTGPQNFVPVLNTLPHLLNGGAGAGVHRIGRPDLLRNLGRFRGSQEPSWR